MEIPLAAIRRVLAGHSRALSFGTGALHTSIGSAETALDWHSLQTWLFAMEEVSPSLVPVCPCGKPHCWVGLSQDTLRALFSQPYRVRLAVPGGAGSVRITERPMPLPDDD